MGGSRGPSRRRSLLTVHQAWSKVMEEVQGIAKRDRNTQGPGYNFRGVDAVMNAVGPKLREHGVMVIPRVISERSENYESKNKALMTSRLVEVEYTVYGPDGSSFTGSAYGESADAGDKAMPKAMSVAYRTFLLQALTVPTDEPDPDSSTNERATQQEPRAQSNQPIAGVGLKKLREKAEQKGWPWDAVAAAFLAKEDMEVEKADDAKILAFLPLLLNGTIKL